MPLSVQTILSLPMRTTPTPQTTGATRPQRIQVERLQEALRTAQGALEALQGMSRDKHVRTSARVFHTALTDHLDDLVETLRCQVLE